MNKLLNGRVLFAALFVVVFGILVWTATGYNQLARTMPLIVSIPVFIGTILNLINEVRASLQPEKAKKEEVTSSAAALEAQQKVVTATPVLEMAAAGGPAMPMPGLSVGTVATPAATPGVVVKSEKKKKNKVTGKERTKRELTGMAWIIGYVVALAVIGFPLATIGYVVGFLRFYAKESWKLTIIYTAVLFAFIWIAFVYFLKSNLYWGLLFDWLGW